MQETMSACFTIVQLPGKDAIVSGHYSNGESGGERVTSFRFPLGDLADAEGALQWAQMAVARVCDGL